MKLLAVIEQDETGYYFAEVPALPGCGSQGKTIAEAKANIKEAITPEIKTMGI